MSNFLRVAITCEPILIINIVIRTYDVNIILTVVIFAARLIVELQLKWIFGAFRGSIDKNKYWIHFIHK